MSKFNFPESILSRPIYSPLQARDGAKHLMIADAEGAEALIDLAQASPQAFAAAHVIYIPKSTGSRYSDALQALNPEVLHIAPSYEAAVPRLRRVLLDAPMGLQICLAGTESLMGQAWTEAVQAGFPPGSIQSEHRGSTARRMQCVHCKGITEDVETDPFECAHCGLNLFVRDHYSRRLAAFQGVCVDAEDPGEVPEKAGIYS
jgi:predicted RNA-binding Zn-ribbon protein involved in translation (DUF1610 family)